MFESDVQPIIKYINRSCSCFQHIVGHEHDSVTYTIYSQRPLTERVQMIYFNSTAVIKQMYFELHSINQEETIQIIE